MRELDLDGRRYVWDGRRWMGKQDFLVPPEHVLQKLRRMLHRDDRAREESLCDPRELLRIAIAARVEGNVGRAERFARRTLGIEPHNTTAVAILSSLLRAKGRARAALNLVDRFQGSDDPYVLTSRGAALCDVGRWDEALTQIRQVLDIERALQGGPSEESLAVYGRIKSNAPHLVGDPQ